MLGSQKLDWKKTLTRNIEKTIDQIEQALSPDSDLYNRLILLKSRHYTAKSEFDQGVVRDSDYRLVNNQLTKSLINLIDDIEQSDVKALNAPGSDATMLGLFGSGKTSIKPELKNYKWDEKSPSILETFDGKDAGLISFGNYEEAIWSGKLGGGVYQLVNDKDEYAVKYHYLNIDDRDMSQSPMSLDVQLDANHHHPGQSAGLIFCFDELTRHYYSYSINNDKEYKLWVKLDNAYRPIISGRSNLIHRGEFNKLAVIKDG
ncbi:MAG: hypothetical protein AAFR97_11110, partial [Bacteroidota bacterium]